MLSKSDEKSGSWTLWVWANTEGWLFNIPITQVLTCLQQLLLLFLLNFFESVFISLPRVNHLFIECFMFFLLSANYCSVFHFPSIVHSSFIFCLPYSWSPPLFSLYLTDDTIAKLYVT